MITDKTTELNVHCGHTYIHSMSGPRLGCQKTLLSAKVSFNLKLLSEILDYSLTMTSYSLLTIDGFSTLSLVQYHLPGNFKHQLPHLFQRKHFRLGTGDGIIDT